MPKPTTGRGRGAANVKLRALPTPTVTPAGEPAGELEKAWWDRIWDLGRAWIAQSDGPQVRLAAETLAERDRLRAWLVELPVEARWYAVSTGQLNPHPAVSQLRVLDAQVVSILGTLGFTPQSRAQLKLDQDDAAKAMQALRDLRGQRSG